MPPEEGSQVVSRDAPCRDRPNTVKAARDRGGASRRSVAVAQAKEGILVESVIGRDGESTLAMLRVNGTMVRVQEVMLLDLRGHGAGRRARNVVARGAREDRPSGRSSSNAS